MSGLVGLFKREPARIIGYVASVLILLYCYWRGLSVEEVLIQLALLIGTVEAIRSRVTPFFEGLTHPTKDELPKV